MSTAKKRLILSVVALVIAIAVATGSTYAWFTFNKEVNVEQMNLSITAGSQGIYVSWAKDGPYKTSLTAAELASAGYNPNASFDAVTSEDGITIKDKDGNALTKNNNKNDKFVEFTLYFRATGDPETNVPPTINLANGGTDATANGGRNTLLIPDASAKPLELFNEWRAINANEFGQSAAYTLNDKIQARGAHAARVSFNVTKHGEAAPSSTRVWDPYKGDPNTFCGSTDTKTDGNATPAKNFALQYYNFKNPDKPIATIGTMPATQTSSDFFKDVLQFNKNNDTGYYECALTVRIWLEGFDGDCLNAVLADKFIADFVFAIPEPTPAA